MKNNGYELTKDEQKLLMNSHGGISPNKNKHILTMKFEINQLHKKISEIDELIYTKKQIISNIKHDLTTQFQYYDNSMKESLEILFEQIRELVSQKFVHTLRINTLEELITRGEYFGY